MPTNHPNPGEGSLKLLPLAGSERAPAAGFRAAAEPVPPDELLEVTLVLRRRAAGEVGAAPADVAAVSETLSALGLEIVATDVPSRRVRVSGSVAQLARVFGTELTAVESQAA